MEFLYVESTELIYTDRNQVNPPTQNIAYDTISTLFYGIRTKKMLLGLIKKPQRYLTIQCAKGQFTVTEDDVGGEVLERYIEQIKDFAHRHRVTIRETTGDGKEDWRL